MSDPSLPPDVREFHCQFCNGKIRIPRDLPPTTAPCPHCQGMITSPAPVTAYPSQPSGFPPPAAYPPGASAYPPAAAAYPPAQVQPYQPQPYQAPMPAPVPAAPAPLTATPLPAPAAKQAPAPAPQEKAVKPSPPGGRRPLKEEQEPAGRKILPIVALGVILLLFAAGAMFVTYRELSRTRIAENAPPPVVSAPPADAPLSDHYIRVGWKAEAAEVLGKFLAATTVEGKLPYILDAQRLKPQLEAFYGGSVIHDQDTPVDAFSATTLEREDHERGIFMMMFDQPPLFDIREFFWPLVSLEVEWGVTDADLLLSAVGRSENFSTEPLQVTAFFKHTPQGLKLDWEIFAQTKYRTFRTFTELPEPGQSEVFRVLIMEDVPDAGRPVDPSVRTYRMADPASLDTAARTEVPIDSPIGKTLSGINWIKQQKRPITRTATVELEWTQEADPQLKIKRFICWEFFSLGGNAAAAAPAPAPVPAPSAPAPPR